MSVGDNMLRCTKNSLLMDAKLIMQAIIEHDGKTDYEHTLTFARGWLARLDWWLRNEENGL